MNTFGKTFGRSAALAIALSACAFGHAALAQDAGTDKPISLTLQNAPVTAALRTLFSSAGITNYTIDSDVRGSVNISVADVPFTVAEKQMLTGVQPNLKDTIENGGHHISVARVDVPVAPVRAITDTTLATGADAGGPPAAEAKRFYRIPIDHYDSAFMAYSLGVGGIKIIPSNPPTMGGGQGQGNRGGGFGGQQGGFGGQQGGFGGQQGGFGGQQGGFGGQQGGFGGGGFGGGGGGFGGGGGGFGGGGFGGGGGGFGGRGYGIWGTR